MAAAGAIVGILGGIAGGSAAETAGKAGGQAYDFNASIHDANAIRARDNAKSDILSLQKTAYKTIGAQRAGYGASGVSGTSGSALDVMADSMSEAILDQQRRKYQGELEYLDQKNQALIATMNAETVRQGGQAAGAASVLSGLGTAASRVNWGTSAPPKPETTYGDYSAN